MVESSQEKYEIPFLYRKHFKTEACTQMVSTFKGYDKNGDGKMDVNEFSVACKLINLKLKGMELPKSLPPQLLNSGQAAGAMGMGMGGMPPNSLPIQPGMGMPGE